VLANALGELLGLGLVGAAGMASVRAFGPDRLDAAPLLVASAMVALGAVEGLIVGAAQWRALRQSLPLLSARAWMAATACGALAAWLLGALPSTIMKLAHSGASPAPPPEPGPLLRYAAAAALGLLAGPVLAAFQWRVLRRHVDRAGWWPLANAAAWALGMPVVFLAVGVAVGRKLGAGSPVSALVLLALAGAVVGAVHGGVLVNLVARTDREAP
jgi:hypothetical protein